MREFGETMDFHVIHCVKCILYYTLHYIVVTSLMPSLTFGVWETKNLLIYSINHGYIYFFSFLYASQLYPLIVGALSWCELHLLIVVNAMPSPFPSASNFHMFTFNTNQFLHQPNPQPFHHLYFYPSHGFHAYVSPLFHMERLDVTICWLCHLGLQSWHLTIPILLVPKSPS